MPNEQLLAHIRAEFARGVDRTAVIQSLIAAGWKVEDINAAMTVVDQRLNTGTSSITQVPQSQYSYVAPAVQTVKYAGFWVRTAAYFVDVLLMSVPISGISFLIFGNTLLDTVYDYSSIVPMVVFFVLVLFMVTKYQATPGKMIVGLQIQRTNGERIGFGRVFLREIIGKFLSVFTFFIGYVMIAWTEKKQGFYDKIADTVVIETNPNKSKTGWVAFAVFTLSVLIIGFGIFGAIIGVAIKSELSNAPALDNGMELALELRALVKQSAIYYDSTGHQYTGYCDSQEALHYLSQASRHGSGGESSTAYVCNDTSDAWAASVFLKGDNHSYYSCIDSMLVGTAMSQSLVEGQTSCGRR